MKLITLSTWALVLAFTLAGAPFVRAEEDPEGSQDAPSTEYAGRMGSNLAQQARDPTASLTMLQFALNYNPSFHNLEGADQTRLVVMPIIPFVSGHE